MDNDDVFNENDFSGRSVTEESQQQQQQQQQPAFDPNDLANTVASAVAQTLTQNQSQQPQREPTPEELAQHFQVWNPGADFVNELNKLNDPETSPEERLKVVNSMRDGIVAQSFRAAELLLEQKLQQLEQRFNPIVQDVQQRQAQAMKQEFESAYPELKGQDELIHSITARLNAEGFKPKNKQEAFEKVASVAEKVMKGVNPNFALSRQPRNPSAPSGRQPMATLGQGGQGGGFQSGGHQPQQNGKLAKFYRE